MSAELLIPEVTMRSVVAGLLLLLLSSAAVAQSKEDQIKPEIDAITARTASQRALAAKLDNDIREAGFELRIDAVGLHYSIGQNVPTRAAVAKMEPDLVEMRRVNDELAACQQFRDKAKTIGFAWDGHGPTEKVFRACTAASQAVASRRTGIDGLLKNWEEKQRGLERVEAANNAFREAVSGNDPRQRAVPLPPSLLKKNASAKNELDGLALFDGAHPSHFVFLRHDVAKPAPASNGGATLLQRTLHRGEAVLPLQASALDGERELSVATIDGIITNVRVDDVAVAPIGGKPGALKASDLVVHDGEGNEIGGPRWLEPDATGFYLGAPTGFLSLLNPPEPDSQKFSESRQKIVDCYQKQMDALDPTGRYRHEYDVVTYGSSGVEKIESAAANFDRRACSACSCSKFNAYKAKLIEKAIAPVQEKEFERYRPVLEKLNKTDFAKAAQGAPQGKVTSAPKGL